MKQPREDVRVPGREGGPAEQPKITETSNRSAALAEQGKSFALRRFGGEVQEKSLKRVSCADMAEKSTAATGKSMTSKAEIPEAKKAERECTMCGDVGFANDLLLCKRCDYRFQHTYCSRRYPDIDMESWACEWCLHEEQKAKQQKEKAIKLGKRKTVNLTESRNKAFEFLLQIAQSLPSVEPEVVHTRQKEHGDCIDRRLNGISRKDQNGFKCGNNNNNNNNTNNNSNQENGSSFKVGNEDQKLVATRCKDQEDALKLGHLSDRLNGSCKEENGLIVKGGGVHVPKRQRCYHATDKSKALDSRWSNLAKSKLHCNASKAIGRRYKLLADVLC